MGMSFEQGYTFFAIYPLALINASVHDIQVFPLGNLRKTKPDSRSTQTVLITIFRNVIDLGASEQGLGGYTTVVGAFTTNFIFLDNSDFVAGISCYVSSYASTSATADDY